MRTWTVLVLAAMVLGAGCGGLRPPHPSVPWSVRAAAVLRSRMGGSADNPLLRTATGTVPVPLALPLFYHARHERPAWCGPQGPLGQAYELLYALEEAGSDGLDPREYGLVDLRKRMVSWQERSADPGGRLSCLIELDVLLTRAFMCCARDLERGRVAPEEIHAEWRMRSPQLDVAALLQGALEMNQVRSSLFALRPRRPQYARLRKALQRYRRVKSEGTCAPSGAAADQHIRRAALVACLRRLGDLPASGDRVPAARRLQAGLRRFQQRHGLEETGVVDSATVAALRVPLASRIRQLELNLERWRWLPRRPAGRYVLVRLEHYELEAVRGDTAELRLPVVVGRPDWPTPVLSSAITSVEIDPPWYIPARIAVEEVLPHARRDAGYLADHHITLFSMTGDSVAVPGVQDSLGWARVTESASTLRVQLVQQPGPDNPLGKVKFYFPNAFGVYLHDTPAQEIFARPVRALSHGCIRVARAIDLAAYLLPAPWTVERLQAAAAQGESRKLALPVPVPVYIMYWSAWVDERGQVQFRDDRCLLDRRLQAALCRRGSCAGE